MIAGEQSQAQSEQAKASQSSPTPIAIAAINIRQDCLEFQLPSTITLLSRLVPLPKPHDTWRIHPTQPLGEISGVPMSRGRLVATNGVLCVIRTSAGKWFTGHLEWFERDVEDVEDVEDMSQNENEEAVNHKPTSTKTKKKTAVDILLEELV